MASRRCGSRRLAFDIERHAGRALLSPTCDRASKLAGRNGVRHSARGFRCRSTAWTRIRSSSRATRARPRSYARSRLYSIADAGYFRAMEIQLIAGRMFDRHRTAERTTSRSSAGDRDLIFHDSTGASAIGKRFRSLPKGAGSPVIGVVGDIATRRCWRRRIARRVLPGGRTLTTRSTARASDDGPRRANDGRLSRRRSRDAARRHELDPTLPTFRCERCDE